MVVNQESKVLLRSLDEETTVPVEGVVTGTIPEWLQGALIRNGAGIHTFGDKMVNHLFDGMAVIHRFEIKNGKATYQNRILQSRAYTESKSMNRLTVSQFGTRKTPDPCKSLLGRYMSNFQCLNQNDMSDNCNVNFCYFGDQLFALTESSRLRRIDEDSLETLGNEVDLTKFVAVNIATAHPHVEEDGTTYNMGNSFGPKGILYNIIKHPAGDSSFEKTEIVASVPSRWKTEYSYYHSFAITENYFVFIEQPLRLQLLKLGVSSLTKATIRDCMKYFPKERAQFTLIDRKTNQVVKTTYEAAAFMMFHHVNAYEQDNHLIVDICHFTDPNVLDDLMLRKLLNESADFTTAQFTRYILPLNVQPPVKKSGYGVNLIKIKGTHCKSYWEKNKVIMCKLDHICSHGIELPRINYQYNGKYYRYVYGLHFIPTSGVPGRIMKIDAETRNSLFWEREGFSVSEPVYVARPNATSEDDGYILFSCVHHEDDKLVLLVILDASTFKETAIVNFKAKGAVTKDFHGIFVAKGETVHRY